MSPLSFKARVGSLISVWWKCVTHSLIFTSGVTPADLLVANMAAKIFSSTYLWAGIGGAENWDLSSCHWVTVWDQADALLTELCRPGWGFEANFELGENPIMEWSFCNRLCCIWDCGLECTLVIVYLFVGSGSRINIIFWGCWKHRKFCLGWSVATLNVHNLYHFIIFFSIIV